MCATSGSVGFDCKAFDTGREGIAGRDPDSGTGIHCDDAGGRGSGWQLQTSPQSGQFMKASLLKSYQFVGSVQPERKERES
jgi:hypothetical protein